MSCTLFIKVRYRKIGTLADNPKMIEIEGLPGGKIGLSYGPAYTLRDALSAALEEYEAENDL